MLQSKIFNTVFFFSLLCLLPFLSKAQSVVHTENSRLEGVKEGITGSIDFNLNFVQNINDVFQSNLNSQFQYKKGNHSILSLGAINLTVFNGSNILNDGLKHFRYGRKINERITAEVFTQAQYNEIIKIKGRYLNGFGPRFSVLKSDSLKLFVGTLYMYEYEEETTGIINNHHRMSSYISTGWQASKAVHFDLIGYYQPDLTNFIDFRVSSEITMEIKVSRRLSYRVALAYFYDAKPPEEIRNVFYNFRNGLKFTL